MGIRTKWIGVAVGTVLGLTVGGWVAGCGEDAGTDSAATSPGGQPAASAPEPLPAGLVLTEAPSGAQDIAEVRRSAKDGDEVVVRGKIGGQVDPFVNGRAAVRLVDVGVPSCADNPKDKCETPWDYCCDVDEAAQKSLTIQVVGADGRPLKTELKGVGGMKPLSELVVRGKVTRAAGSDAVVINATALHVKGG